MTQATETENRELKDLLTGMREEMRLGFANVDTKFAEVDKKIELGFANVTTQITRLDGRIDILETKIEAKIDKLDVKIDNLEIRLDGKIENRFDLMTAKLNNIDINAKTTVDLAEKLGELKNWKQIAIVIFTASVSGAITWYIRSGNP
jgi:hypothetical protein